jgi:hypothetical protein
MSAIVVVYGDISLYVSWYEMERQASLSRMISNIAYFSVLLISLRI